MEKIAKGLGALRRGKVFGVGRLLRRLQVAALLLERTTEHFSGDEAENLADAVLLQRKG